MRKSTDLIDNLKLSKDLLLKKMMEASCKLGSQTLDFLYKNEVINYREKRALSSTANKSYKNEEAFLNLLRTELSENIDFIRVTHIVGDNPFEFIGAWPMYEFQIIEQQKYIKLITDKKTELSKAYFEFIMFFEELSKKTFKINKWMNDRVKNGTLEKHINHYLKKEEKYVPPAKKEKSKNPTHGMPKKMISKILGKRELQSEYLPAFPTIELDVIHVLLNKSVHMSEKEKEIANKIDPTSNQKNSRWWRIVVEKADALNMCYEHGSRDNKRRKEFFRALDSLTKKRIKWVIGEDAKAKTFQILETTIIKEPDIYYNVTMDGVEKDKYFSVQLPIELLHLISKNYAKIYKFERRELRSIPPKLTQAQERFKLKIDELKPYSKKGKVVFKRDVSKFIKELWPNSSDKKTRHIKDVEAFGTKFVELDILDSFQTIYAN